MVQKQLDEEKILNSSLQKNQSEWKEKFTRLEKEFHEFKATKSQVSFVFISTLAL